MNYSKHSKPVKRNADDSEPELDKMGMNWRSTREAYVTREIEEDEEEFEERMRKNREKLEEVHSKYRPIRNGVVRPYGR